MAITLNKYAIRCEQAAIANGSISHTSSFRTFLYDVSRSWRKEVNATSYKSGEQRKYSERQIAGADVIIDQLLCLQRDGCENIEQLIRDRIRQRFDIL